jgi:agmatinase
MTTLGAMFGHHATGTAMGLPAWDGGPASAVVIGADGCTPYPSVGHYCAGGPRAIRAATAPFDGSKWNFDIDAPAIGPRPPADAGDLAIGDDAGANRRMVREAVARIAAAGAVPILLGGDDSLPIPMLEALQGPLAILQIDAHIDWRDEVEGTRWGLSSTMRRASEMGHVARIVQVGQRGIGSARPSDVEEARARGVRFVPAFATDLVGEALAQIPDGARVAVCLDLDALDPAIMPAAIGRTAGGLSVRQVLDLILGVHEQGSIAALAMTEYMPARDVDGLGATVAAQILMAALGLLSAAP